MQVASSNTQFQRIPYYQHTKHPLLNSWQFTNSIIISTCKNQTQNYCTSVHLIRYLHVTSQYLVGLVEVVSEMSGRAVTNGFISPMITVFARSLAAFKDFLAFLMESISGGHQAMVQYIHTHTQDLRPTLQPLLTTLFSSIFLPHLMLAFSVRITTLSSTDTHRLWITWFQVQTHERDLLQYLLWNRSHLGLTSCL